MKRIAVLLVALMAISVANAQTWSLDKSHAKLSFGVTHLMVSNVEGSFNSFDAKFTSSKEDFTDASIELTADVSTVDTNNEKRDEHLRAPDFFDAAKYPAITFKSKSLKKVADKKYKLAGDLTMHGVTKPVELDVTLGGTAIHPYTKKTIAGFKITGTLKRADFGVGAGTPGAVVSDEVSLEASAEFIKDDVKGSN